MVTQGTSLVTALQSALGVSQFGAMVCLNPTMVRPSALYAAETLRDLTRQIVVADATIGGRLETHTSAAINANKDEETVREAWQNYTRVIAGLPSDTTAASHPDLISVTRNRLLKNAARGEWIEEALDVIRTPDLVKDTVLKRLDANDSIKLELSACKGSAFVIRLADENGSPTIQIGIPNRERVLTEKQLHLLIARAILLRYAKAHISEDRLEPLHTVSSGRLTSSPSVFHEATLVDSMKSALDGGRFKKHSHLIPIDRGLDVAFSATALLEIAEAIAKDEANFGAELYSIAKRTDRADTDQKRYLAWVKFTNLIRKAEPASTSKSVEIPTLREVLRKLGSDFDERERLLMEAMQSLEIPNPEILLYSEGVRLDRKNGIYFSFTEAQDDNVTVRADLSIKNYITVHISVPKEHGPISAEEIILLTARSLAVAEIKSYVPAKIYKKHLSMPLSEIRRPIPLTIMTWEKALHMGPAAVGNAKLRSLISAANWLTTGSLVMNPVTRAQLMYSELKPHKYFGDKSAHHPMPAQMRPGYNEENIRNWMPFSSLQGVDRLLFRPTDFLRISDYTFIFEIDEDQADRLNMHLETNDKTTWIYTRLSSRTFQQLKPANMIDIAIRATAFGKPAASAKRAGTSFTHIHSRTNVTLGEIHDSFDLPFRVEMARAALMLAYEYSGLSKEYEEDTLNITGNVADDEKQKFAMMLQSISLFLSMTEVDEWIMAWSEILRIRRWHLFDSGIRPKEPTVDIFPLGHVGMINLHTSPFKISPNDWLYMASAIAANPGHAIRFTPKNRDEAMGRSGNRGLLYDSVAANRLFTRFGVYDPKAKMPKSIALNLPGGVPLSKNPYLKSASPKDRERYVRALLWFAVAAIPDAWKPRADDDKHTIKTKYRDMSKAYHPDRCKDVEQVALLKNAATHWEIVTEIHDK
ncbi:MAG: hypothetical protein HN337_00850 [Deltaproteobacteria bacterium]|jgi:hypothetical protein|nr:hypothetical protein [Deltaproteobacteria bacterium]